MNVTCIHCETVYRVDPEKIPQAGVDARCSQCSGVFRIAAGDESRPAESAHDLGSLPALEGSSGSQEGGGITDEAEVQPETVATDSAPEEREQPPVAQPEAHAGEQSGSAQSGARPVSPFGTADPDARARRLARALVSDIVVYHPERRERSRQNGTLRQEFRDEIRKSWEEYVGQVGADLARGTPYFREALNELLAGGDRIF